MIIMQAKRMCWYIPRDSFVEGRGYRVAIVTENTAGYALTGTWPYTGAPGESLPYFWGNRGESIVDNDENYKDACATAASLNKRQGLSDKDVMKIIASSMFKAARKAKKVKARA
jgi:hypothetical protein